MKFSKLRCITATTLLTVLAIPAGLAAQEHHKQKPRYELIDLGTLGGPQSYEQGSTQIVDNRGTALGWADTSTPDPFPQACFNPDCFVSHGFRWQKHNPIIDLGALADGWSSLALWISDHGQIDGTSQNGTIDPLTGIPEQRAVIWKGRHIQDLGTLGGNESFSIGDNSQEQVVGGATNTVPDSFSGFGTQIRAFLWQNPGPMQDLGTLLTGTDSTAYVINEHGQVTGASYINSTPNSNNGPACPSNVPTQDPFFWENGTMTDIGTLGGNCGFPFLINNHGQVAGQSDLPGDLSYHPFFWEKGMQTPKDLGTLGGDNGFASWINDDGVAVGRGDLPGSQVHHATLWSDGKVTDLGTVQGDACSTAYGINSRNQVVGISAVCEHTGHAFLWEDGGPMIDLNMVIAPGSGLQLTAAWNINDRGEIAGFGVLSNGDQHAYLLIPCDDSHGHDGDCENHAAFTETTVNNAAPATQNPTATTPQSATPGGLFAQPRAGGYRTLRGGA